MTRRQGGLQLPEQRGLPPGLGDHEPLVRAEPQHGRAVELRRRVRLDGEARLGLAANTDLRRQLRLAQDYLADARAAAQAPEPTDYAEYLVTLARRRLATPALALGITDRRSNLTRRVHMLLLNPTPLSRRCRRPFCR